MKNGQRIKHRKTLEEAQESLGKLAEGTSAALYAKIAALIRHISAAFKSAKETAEQAAADSEGEPTTTTE